MTDDGKVVRELNAGDTFGEQALYENSTRGLTVRAKGSVKALALARETLTTILGTKIQEVIHNNSQRWSLQNDELLRK